MEKSFFHVLHSDDEFAMAIGRVTLSSARLETSIRDFMETHGEVQIGEKAPLGGLISALLKHHRIDRTAGEHLQFLLHQRNYFVHKLHENLSEYPEDDVERRRFINRARSLGEEMDFFSDLLVGNKAAA